MEFEIGLLLFNRPKLAQKAIISLVNQNPQLDLSRVHVLIDGYANSKDEYVKRLNRTQETIDLVQRYLPECDLIVPDSNLGIALAYERLGEEMFLRNNAGFAVFLEEDLLMKRNYFDELTKIKNTLISYDDVAMFSASGDSARYFTRQVGQFKPMNHFWNYALRREHYLERRALLSEYISIISEDTYWNKNNQKIYEWARDRHLKVLGTSQDLVKRGIAESFDRIFLTSNFKFARYLGKVGEHSTPRVYRQQGYGKYAGFDFLKNKEGKNYEVNIQELRTITNEHRYFLEQNPALV